MGDVNLDITSFWTPGTLSLIGEIRYIILGATATTILLKLRENVN